MSCFEDDAVTVEKPEDEMIFSEPVDFVENPMSESTEKITVGDIPIMLPEEGKSKNNREVDLDSSAEDTITVGDIGIVLPEDGKLKNDKEVDLAALHEASKIEEAKPLGDSKNVAEKLGGKDKGDKAKKEDKGEKKKKDKSAENDSDDKLKNEKKKSKESEDHEEKVKQKKVKEGKKEKKDEVAKLKRKLEKIDLKMARILVNKEDYLKRLENALEKKRLDDELACKTQQWENHIQSELLSMGVSELSNQFSKLQTSADKS